MVSLCFYFQVHQPFRLRRYSVFDIHQSHDYYDHKKNRDIMKKVAGKCYLPTNKLMKRLIDKHNGDFKISYSITGVALDQFELYAPEVLQSFQELNDTGCVEFLSETYNHSLSFLHSKKEFQQQVDAHTALMNKHFNTTPSVFRNTELIFNNELAQYMEKKGYKGILAEGADHILGWRSPNFLYQPSTTSKIKALLKNYKLSDDVAFRFSEKSWKEHPLTVEKFSQWVNAVNGNGHVVNLFMDYETFGEHQWESTGIFRFLELLPQQHLSNQANDFVTPSEAVDRYPTKGEIDIHHPVSWADMERDLSAWLGNDMQRLAMKELYKLEPVIKKSNDPKLLKDWRMMQTSDHFYYMCTKWFADGDVHKYFNPYESPYEGYVAFFNVLNDLSARAQAAQIAE